MTTQPMSGPPAQTDGVSERSGLDPRQALDMAADRDVKPGMATSEFIGGAVATAGILISAAVSDNFQADEAWPLIALISIGYMLSRGLAKLGAGRSGRRHY
ncbi:MAG TPA: hypothetical protein VNT32_03365 [Thermoleophilaceae bacterium]|nr:hypothetical protein [Thermoleophilaceae bacterium]